MKKIALFLAAILTIALLCACGDATQPQNTTAAPIETSAPTGATAEPTEAPTEAIDECALYGHDYVTTVTAPTCAEQGYTTHTCTRCGDTFTDEYTEALGHIYKVTETVKSTYNTAGHVTSVCTRCGDTQVEELPLSDYISGVETLDKYVSYAEVVQKANAVREATFADPDPFAEAFQYVYNPVDEATLLTAEEIALLRDTSRKQKATVTYEEAVADMDLYFRALKYAYGPYNYMGGDEFFNSLKNEILDKLEQYKGGRLSVYTLREIWQKTTAVIRDAHLNGGNKYFKEYYRYTYFYCTEQNYALDADGYYKIIDGKKWYYVGCDIDNVSMQYSFDDDYNIVYSPVCFRPIKDENGNGIYKVDITLKNGDVTKKQTVMWIRNDPYGYTSDNDYKFIQEGGITYISQRGFKFDTWQEMQDAAKEYYQAGVKARKSNAIIIDFRSNKGGGSDDLYESFAKGISGRDVNFRQFHAVRWNALDSQYTTAIGEEVFEFLTNDAGHVTKNDIPIIILVDEYCGSGGDEVFCMTRTLENVIVIGSNNGGLYINDVKTYNLPNSGLLIPMGGRFWPHYSMENTDGIGEAPDIWCNPFSALDMALALIVNEGLASAEAAEAISDAAW